MSVDLITSGYCSLDKIIKVKSTPVVGKTSIIGNNDFNNIYYGGCNCNVAVNLARLGYQAAPILRVGKDYESSGFYQYLKENRVSLMAVSKLEDEVTSSTCLIETPENDHITLFHPGAMDNELFTSYNDAWFDGAKCGLMTVASLKDNQAFLKKCIKYNIPLFLGMKMDSEAFPKAFIKECLDNVEVLFTNETEATCIAEIYNLDDYKMLIQVLPKVKTIIITKGKHGSCALYKENNDTKFVEVGIVKVDKVIDTVGSGDAFIAGYIYGYLNDYSIKTCLEFGSTLASFVIEGFGSTTNSPNKSEFIDRYLNHYNKEK